MRQVGSERMITMARSTTGIVGARAIQIETGG